jgi:Carbohydrate family 9 binding domain-like/Secretion system C-terminal sorting domain/Cadherin-like beta sandwich domain
MAWKDNSDTQWQGPNTFAYSSLSPTIKVVIAQTDFTSLIVNPSFETHDYTGWTWTGRNGGWQDVNTDGDNTKDGTYIAGHWGSPIAAVECSQVVRGIPSGYYEVSALATVTKNRISNQRLFAGNKSTLYGTATCDANAYSKHNLDILGATETYSFGNCPFAMNPDGSQKETGPFYKLSVVQHVTDDSLMIGFRFSGKADTLSDGSSKYDYSYTTQGDLGFFKFDGFTLTNVGKRATLDNITVMDGAIFDVPFTSSTLSYTVSLPKGTTTVDPEIKLSYEGTPVTGDGSVDVSSGTGKSTIKVTSLDGSTIKTYTINYIVLTVSKEARLSEISVTDSKLYPAFSPEVYSYKAVVHQNTPNVTVAVTPKDNDAIIAGDGLLTLNNDGKDSSMIVVTSQDGTVVKTYKIKYQSDAAFYKVATAPNINGIISANEYANDQWLAQSATIGTSAKGSSSKFQMVHDDANLYIAVQTIDSTKHVETTIGNEYERDCVEFYFSMDPAMTSNGVGVTSYRIQRDGAVITGGGFASIEAMNAAGVQFGVVSNANSYVVEAKIPLDSLVKTAAFDLVNFKFEIKTADNTTGAAGGRTYQMAWKDNSDTQWQGPNTFAYCSLSPIIKVAINKVQNNESSIYLDKATRTLHITGTVSQVTIYDLRGSLVSSETLKGKNTVNVSNLQRGVYIVKYGKNVSKIVL